MARQGDARLTRRSLLLATAAGTGSLIGAQPALAAGLAVRRARMRSAPVPAGAAQLLFERWVGAVEGATAPIDVGRPFALVGAHWRSPARAALELRARLADGSWSPWVSASSAGHGPDSRGHEGAAAAGLGPGSAGEPLWAGEADAVQLRARARVRGVRLVLIAPPRPAFWTRAQSGDPASARGAARVDDAPLAQPILPAGPGQPPIIARAAWARGHAPPAAAPSYGAVRMAFVHHTDGLNGYSAAQVPSIIYAIYLYHRYSNGWNDIGYNFVIDRFGRVWEARAGGIDLPVVGAQAGGYNLESTGVAILGTFNDVLPSAAALNALERLLAWKLSLHGLPADGKVALEVDPADAFYTPFAPGQVISLPRVAGHRQGCSTDCPGNALFARLPRVRARVAALAGPATRLTLTATGASAPSYLSTAALALSFGQPARIEGRLTSLRGIALGGAEVELQQVLEGRTATVAMLTTAADGGFSTSLTPSAGMLLRALHAEAPASVSPLLALAVVPVLTLALISGSPLQIAGTVAPASLQEVTLELYRAGGARPLRRRRVTAAGGRFAADFGRLGRGRYLLIARTPPSDRYAAASSPPLSVRIS